MHICVYWGVQTLNSFNYQKYVNKTICNVKAQKEADGILYYDDLKIIAAAPITQRKFKDADAVGVGDHAFSHCKELTSVNMPSLRYIGEYAFGFCRNLREFSPLTNVAIMREAAFFGAAIDCADLSSLTNVPPMAFSDCKELVSVKLGDELRTIEVQAFFKCERLEALELPSKLKYIGRDAFFKTAIKEITIPKGVKVLKDGVFCLCRQLHSIEIPDGSVEHIENSALSGCESLKSIYLPPSVQRIDTYSFTATPLETVICEKDSYAEKWARENGLAVKYRSI